MSVTDPNPVRIHLDGSLVARYQTRRRRPVTPAWGRPRMKQFIVIEGDDWFDHIDHILDENIREERRRDRRRRMNRWRVAFGWSDPNPFPRFHLLRRGWK